MYNREGTKGHWRCTSPTAAGTVRPGIRAQSFPQGRMKGVGKQGERISMGRSRHNRSAAARVSGRNSSGAVAARQGIKAFSGEVRSIRCRSAQQRSVAGTAAQNRSGVGSVLNACAVRQVRLQPVLQRGAQCQRVSVARFAIAGE